MIEHYDKLLKYYDEAIALLQSCIKPKEKNDCKHIYGFVNENYNDHAFLINWKEKDLTVYSDDLFTFIYCPVCGEKLC